MQRLSWQRAPSQWTQVVRPCYAHLSAHGSRCFATPSGAPSKFAAQRVQSLGGSNQLAAYFPRLKAGNRDAINAARFLALNSSVTQGKTEEATYVVYGRVASRRKQGSKLLFVDVESGGAILQAVINLAKLDSESDGAFHEFRKTVQRGDWVSVSGSSYTTESGQFSILANCVPSVLSVSLQPLPEEVRDQDFLSRNRHVERILDSSKNDVLILRHRLMACMRGFFDKRSFTEVNTPLLTSGFGGAVARPFETTASEFPSTTLNLRIAPELWLKRLIVGNLDRVYEIGSAFRNEGVDATHNPEFTICEFYQTMTDLEQLMTTTAQLFAMLACESRAARNTLRSVPDPAQFELEQPFGRISFIPAIQSAVQAHGADWRFPDLGDPKAVDRLLKALDIVGLARPDSDPPSIPKVLDLLSSELLENQITSPTWIMHHPECMSPLAKSFEYCMADEQRHVVSARAELFIRGREYVNCYEEENSPIEQRRKFEEQLRHRNVEGEVVIDENYIEALEWGMPPTGGWGCGIDRLVMLLSGRRRIADVLAFGTLTNVAALGAQTEHNGRR